MKNLYDKARKNFLDGALSWSSHTIKLLLVKSSYSPVITSDEFLSDIVSGNRITGGTSAALGGKSSTAGAAKSTNVLLSAVPSGQTIAAIVLFRDTGVEATSELIAYRSDGIPLPLVCNGQDVTVFCPSDGWFVI